MDLYKDLIRKRIKEKFRTIENFSQHIGIPRTTINFILKNGVAASNYGLVKKVLKELDIFCFDETPIAIDDSLLEFIKNYSALDEMGKHTVRAVAKTEFLRTHPHFFEDAAIAAYNSINSRKPLSEEEKTILNLIDKIKKG